MRIAHVCLAAFYIDGFGYQENILPRIHKAMGHDVAIFASTENYIGKTERSYVQPGRYLNEDGIPVERFAYKRWLPSSLAQKIRAYEGAVEAIDEFDADLIFLHDAQFWDLPAICRNAAKKSIRVVADCHTDFVNSARGVVSHRLLHGGLYRWLIQSADRHIAKYWATLPMRATFLATMYGIDPNKIELLPFGADDASSNDKVIAEKRSEFRKSYDLCPDDKVFVTGGKLDLRKNIHILAQRFAALSDEGRLGGSILVVFGQPDLAVQEVLARQPSHAKIHYVGWLDPKEISSLMASADIAVFPGTHSVLWEQAVGLGIPSVFHVWPEMGHLDLGGNAAFIESADQATLDPLLVELADPGSARLEAMRNVAQEMGPRVFSYSAIALKALT